MTVSVIMFDGTEFFYYIAAVIVASLASTAWQLQ